MKNLLIIIVLLALGGCGNGVVALNNCKSIEALGIYADSGVSLLSINKTGEVYHRGKLVFIDEELGEFLDEYAKNYWGRK